MEIRELREADKTEYVRIWQECFGDSEDVIQEFLGYFEESLHRYVLEDDGKVRAALTQFSMGTLVFGGSPVAVPETELLVSYAIGTESASRSHGYGAAITEFAKERARSAGKGSVLCPAEPGLVDFYVGLKYLPIFWMEERTVRATAGVRDCRLDERVDTQVDEFGREPLRSRAFRRLSAAEYGRVREEFLQNRIHVRLSDAVLRCAEDAGPEDGAFWISEDEEILFAVEDDGSVDADGGNHDEAGAKSKGGDKSGVCVKDDAGGREYRMLEGFRRDGGALTESDLQEILAWSGRSALRVRMPMTEDRKRSMEPRWKESLVVQALAVLPRDVRIPGALTESEENRRAWLEATEWDASMAMPWFGFPFE